jgi:hypothetical protein
MLVNLSYSPSLEWQADVQNAVKDKFGSVIDIEIPYTLPTHTSEEIEMIAKECLQNIIKQTKGNDISIYVSVCDNFTFMFKFIEYAKAMGYDCYSIVIYPEEMNTPCGVELQYKFVQFRKY